MARAESVYMVLRRRILYGALTRKDKRSLSKIISGKRIQSFSGLLTSVSWSWFNFPEGTHIAYRNNSGETDTAVFGKIKQYARTLRADLKNCTTTKMEMIEQDIYWVNNLKGHIRPVKLISKGGDLGHEIQFSDGHTSDYRETDFNDTLTFKNKKLSDVFKSACDKESKYFVCTTISKTNFYISFSYKTSKDSLVVWNQ